MDIVERLRKDADIADDNWPEVFCVKTSLAREAANEIERLREALQKMEASRSEWSTGVGERVVYYAGKIKAQADEIERLRDELYRTKLRLGIYEARDELEGK